MLVLLLLLLFWVGLGFWVVIRISLVFEVVYVVGGVI